MDIHNENDAFETMVSIERVLEGYLASAPRVSHADIKRLCENLSGYLRETPAFRRSSVDIIKAIRAGSPALFGESIIGSSVVGPVALYNVATTNGFIYGCGAICFADPEDIPDGAIVHLRHGLIVNSVADVEKCIVGWVRADDGLWDPDEAIQGVDVDASDDHDGAGFGEEA